MIPEQREKEREAVWDWIWQVNPGPIICGVIGGYSRTLWSGFQGDNSWAPHVGLTFPEAGMWFMYVEIFCFSNGCLREVGPLNLSGS